jgi:hypothetical protein
VKCGRSTEIRCQGYTLKGRQLYCATFDVVGWMRYLIFLEGERWWLCVAETATRLLK